MWVVNTFVQNVGSESEKPTKEMIDTSSATESCAVLSGVTSVYAVSLSPLLNLRTIRERCSWSDFQSFKIKTLVKQKQNNMKHSVFTAWV